MLIYSHNTMMIDMYIYIYIIILLGMLNDLEAINFENAHVRRPTIFGMPMATLTTREATTYSTRTRGMSTWSQQGDFGRPDINLSTIHSSRDPEAPEGGNGAGDFQPRPPEEPEPEDEEKHMDYESEEPSGGVVDMSSLTGDLLGKVRSSSMYAEELAGLDSEGADEYGVNAV